MLRAILSDQRLKVVAAENLSAVWEQGYKFEQQLE